MLSCRAIEDKFMEVPGYAGSEKHELEDGNVFEDPVVDEAPPKPRDERKGTIIMSSLPKFGLCKLCVRGGDLRQARAHGVSQGREDAGWDHAVRIPPIYGLRLRKWEGFCRPVGQVGEVGCCRHRSILPRKQPGFALWRTLHVTTSMR